jgi:hypothetical protein
VDGEEDKRPWTERRIRDIDVEEDKGPWTLRKIRDRGRRGG